MGDYEEVERMGEVVWVDCGVDGWVGGDEMYASARERVFEDGEHGEIVGGVEGGVGAEEEASVVGVLGGSATWEVDFL